MYAAKVRYSNEFVVEVKGGPEVADEIAQRHGFKNLGKVIMIIVTCICMHIIVSSQIVREGPSLLGIQYVRHILFYQQKVWFSPPTFQLDTLVFIRVTKAMYI